MCCHHPPIPILIVRHYFHFISSYFFTSLALTNCLCVSYTCRLRHFVRGTVRTEGRSSSQVGLPVKLFIDLGWILELAAWCLQLRSWQSTIGNPYAINGCAWEICCGICSMQWEMYRFAILGSRLHNFFLIEWASHLTSQADSSTVFQKFTEHLFFVLKFRSLQRHTSIWLPGKLIWLNLQKVAISSHCCCLANYMVVK